MRKAVLYGLTAVASLAVAVPMSAVTTFVLWPVWSWCERRLDIESVGHSAPAEWCFFVTYALFAVSLLGILTWRALRTTPCTA